eukprot:COSAG02_NODE_11700_length_1672_cov_0.891926_1_plen_142_part_00
MIIPTSSARILVYSQNYTTFGPSQLAFLSTVKSTLLLDRLRSHFSVQSKAIYFTGLSSFIHLTIMRNTKGGNTDIRCYIARLDSTIFLKLQESNFLLYATRFSIMRSLVKRLGMGLPKRQERKDDDVRRGASGMMERRGSS